MLMRRNGRFRGNIATVDVVENMMLSLCWGGVSLLKIWTPTRDSISSLDRRESGSGRASQSASSLDVRIGLV